MRSRGGSHHGEMAGEPIFVPTLSHPVLQITERPAMEDEGI